MSTPTTHAPPHTGNWSTQPASDQQRSYLRDLAEKKNVTPEVAELIKQLAWRPDLLKGQASSLITKLRGRSDKPRAATPSGRVARPAGVPSRGQTWLKNPVPSGYYAVTQEDVDGYDDLTSEFDGELLLVAVRVEEETTYMHKLTPDTEGKEFTMSELTPKQRRELQGIIRHDTGQYTRRFNEYLDTHRL